METSLSKQTETGISPAQRVRTRRRPVEVAYTDTIDLMRSVVWQHMRQYHKNPQEFEELFSAANLQFMKAYKTHKKNRNTKFSTWLWTHISLHLRNVERQQQTEKHRVDREMQEPRQKSAFRSAIHTIDLIDELGYDGMKLILIIRRSLPDLEQLIAGCTPHMAYKRFYRFLLRDKGWSRRRILNAFRQVRTLIRG